MKLEPCQKCASFCPPQTKTSVYLPFPAMTQPHVEGKPRPPWQKLIKKDYAIYPKWTEQKV